MSTNSVAMVHKINAAFAEKNLYMLASPVSRGPGGAASGKVAIWVRSDEQQYNRHKPVLDAMSDQTAYIGPISDRLGESDKAKHYRYRPRSS